MIKATIFFSLLIFFVLSFGPKTEEQIIKSFARHDRDKDGHLNERQFKRYFDEDYMKDFKNIDIDPKFIDGTFRFLKEHDKDENGMTIEELIEGVLPKEKATGSNEPEYYPEQEL